MMLGAMSDKHTILKNSFGHTEFRPGQEEVIDAILAGQDVLAIMPTGAGKSLCYQIPALMLDGLTVVISPLISLMKDQVNALTAAGVRAACLNSALSPAEYIEVISKAARGDYSILYIAPERLSGAEIQRFADAQSIPLVVIDEAHCVSQWGHDFRPSYLQIAAFISSLRRRPVTAAFTATATSKVKEDILWALKLREPHTLTTGFDRENLYFGVEKPKDKAAALLEFLSKRKNRSGIVYCSTRKTVEEVWSLLLGKGFPATRYHAGLPDRERHENQDDFQYDRRPIIVATNALGMGIDKSNVSFVVHYNMPKNIESYYQEAGRAGRDGGPAECVLFYSGADVQINQFLIKNSRDEEEEKDEALIAHNLELLKQMTFYATGTDCLRSRLLSYFGEKPPSFCGNCSNCLTKFEEADIRVDAQKIISCVYRLKQRRRSFGKTTVIDILRGSKRERILSMGLDTLSTWGIMADTDAHRVRVILDYLVDKGYLTLEGNEYPVLVLCAASEKILRLKEPLIMMVPRESEPPPSHKKPIALDLLPEDEILFTKLTRLRKKLAQEAGAPAYIIFPDSSLRDMCRKRPVTERMFMEISGVGAVKNEKYGPIFTALIREHEEETALIGE
ncbi:ATP-dependent DNA helicase RecQ [Spirochaetia bacterium]|nr:ATP-dependent DNA helicase RecQ [Spirochaetia bacterium]